MFQDVSARRSRFRRFPSNRVAQPVDHGRIGLQAHPLSEAIHEYRGDRAPLGGLAGFLLDDGGKDECLVGSGERQGCIAFFPGLGQAPGHLGMGALEDLRIRRAGEEPVGVGKEETFERAFPNTECGANLGFRKTFQRRAHVGMGSHLRQPLPQRRSLHEGDLDRQDVARGKLVEQFQRRDGRAHAISPRLQRRRLPENPAEKPENPRVGKQALFLEAARDGSQVRPALHRKVVRDARRLESSQAVPGRPRERRKDRAGEDGQGGS